jgi:hypothetical protein
VVWRSGARSVSLLGRAYVVIEYVRGDPNPAISKKELSRDHYSSLA